jgi:hypothetical protein
MAAQHHRHVDRAHHERRGPAARLRVEARAARARLRRPRRGDVRRFRRAERIRVDEDAPQRRIGGRLAHHVQQARDRAARDAAAQRTHAHGDARAGLPEAASRLALQVQHAEIGRNGVEAAAVHQPRTRSACRRLVTLDHAPDPLHLAGQVGIVGARSRAGRDQRLAVQRIGADGRDDGARLPAQRGERASASPASATSSGSDAASRLCCVVLCRGAPAHLRPATAARARRATPAAPRAAPVMRPASAPRPQRSAPRTRARAVQTQQLLAEQPTDEARRAEHDEVQWAFGARHGPDGFRHAPLLPATLAPRRAEYNPRDAQPAAAGDRAPDARADRLRAHRARHQGRCTAPAASRARHAGPHRAAARPALRARAGGPRRLGIPLGDLLVPPEPVVAAEGAAAAQHAADARACSRRARRTGPIRSGSPRCASSASRD